MFEFAIDPAIQKNTDFHRACVRGDAETAIRLLEEGADPNTMKSDMSALLVAIHDGHASIARAILSKEGVDPNAANLYNWTPLHAAVKLGDPELVRLVCQAGAIVNRPDNGGETPVYLAASLNSDEIVDVLFEFAADPRIETATRDTCMHCCARNGNLDMAKKMAKRGAFANVVNEKGESPDSCASDPQIGAMIAQMEITRKVEDVISDQAQDAAAAGEQPAQPAKRRLLKA